MTRIVPMPLEYPWYALVAGPELAQGDFLDRCPILVPPDEFRIDDGPVPSGITVGVRTYDVVVMSQSCDLEQGKLQLVLVCPHWSLEQLEQSSDFFKSRKGKEQLRRGNIPGYHMLEACDVEGHIRGIRVVDFRTVYSLPFEFVQEFASNSGPRLRLLPPYREHLSQAFARFFMRVGLPVDIHPFT